MTVPNALAPSDKDAKSSPRVYGKIVLTFNGNCLLPDEKFEQTPSQQDGLDVNTETDLRILGCELLQTAGILLKLPQVAMATGQVLFQRFFYSKSFVRHNMEITAMSCICLASKIEEAPRRIRDVINVFHHIRQVKAQKVISSMLLDHNYITLKTQVIKAERRVLKELGFCVHVKHPHKLIVMYLQVLGYEKHQKFMQMAWNYMNDSLRTDVFVRYQPETIACACIYLTARKLSISLPSNPAWYEIFKVNEVHIVDVCFRITELYSRPKVDWEQLECAVENLKSLYMESKAKNRNTEQTTPPTTTTEPPNSGKHNAWGGFISRTLPAPENVAKPKVEATPEEKPAAHVHKKKSRHRSKTPTRVVKKKTRRQSSSSSESRDNKKRAEKRNTREEPEQRAAVSVTERTNSKNDRDKYRDRADRNVERVRESRDSSKKSDRYSSSTRNSSSKHREKSKDHRR